MAAGEQVQTGRGWVALVAAGAVSAIAGVLALVWPDITLLALALIAGINLMLLSGLSIGLALADSEADERTLRIVIGVLGIVAGLVIVRRPGETLLVLVIATGIWLVLSGVVELVSTLFVGGGRLLRLLGGAVDVILGILVMALPSLSLTTLAVLIGLSFIVHGVVLAYGGWQLRHAAERPMPGATPAPA